MSKKYYLIMIAILVVLNIFSWRIWWSYPPMKPFASSEMLDHERGRKEGRGMKVLVEKLNLSDEQKKEFEQLRKDYFSKLQGIDSEMRPLRAEVLRYSLKENSNEKKDSIFDLMVNYKMKFELETFKHFSDMRKLCTEEQKLVFDTLITNMFNRSNRFRDHKSKGRKPKGNDMMNHSIHH
ncbi:periplasmic heavy metal sensor [Labilibacter sediminis]|nr:periplasmic heavy metal sensor [Labilibacter sediminis]